MVRRQVYAEPSDATLLLRVVPAAGLGLVELGKVLGGAVVLGIVPGDFFRLAVGRADVVGPGPVKLAQENVADQVVDGSDRLPGPSVTHVDGQRWVRSWNGKKASSRFVLEVDRLLFCGNEWGPRPLVRFIPLISLIILGG